MHTQNDIHYPDINTVEIVKRVLSLETDEDLAASRGEINCPSTSSVEYEKIDGHL